MTGEELFVQDFGAGGAPERMAVVEESEGLALKARRQDPGDTDEGAGEKVSQEAPPEALPVNQREVFDYLITTLDYTSYDYEADVARIMNALQRVYGLRGGGLPVRPAASLPRRCGASGRSDRPDVRRSR